MEALLLMMVCERLREYGTALQEPMIWTLYIFSEYGESLESKSPSVNRGTNAQGREIPANLTVGSSALVLCHPWLDTLLRDKWSLLSQSLLHLLLNWHWLLQEFYSFETFYWSVYRIHFRTYFCDRQACFPQWIPVGLIYNFVVVGKAVCMFR